MPEIDYDQLIEDMKSDNERQLNEWQREVLDQFEKECVKYDSRTHVPKRN